MGIQFRKMGTTLLAAVAAIALSAPAALAQDAPEAAPAPAFHISNVSFATPAASTSTDGLGLMQASQSSHHEGFGFGVMGGFLFSSLGTSPLNGAALSSKTGEAFGIFFGGNRPGRIGVEGQLLYNIRKASTAASQNLSINSLEIPVLIRANIGSQSLKGVLVYIIVGPAVDLQLKASQDGLDIGDNYKGVNLDVIFGGGVEITRFFVEAREDIGIRSVNNGDFSNTNNIHTKTFALLFGFRVN